MEVNEIVVRDVWSRIIIGLFRVVVLRAIGAQGHGTGDSDNTKKKISILER